MSTAAAPMTASAKKVQRTYLVLTLLSTFAASFIWGVNTLFLLDAGLSNTQAFGANAFFTIGQVIFEVPTGVVADTVGRRASFLLGAATLFVSTLPYLLMWQIEAPFWGWAVASAIIGLGFTFFSGAVEAWLVDALTASGFNGNLESVFGRGQTVAGSAMLVGSVIGGVVAQLTNLGVRYILRAVMLTLTFGVAWRVMHDTGFTPVRGVGVIDEVKTVAKASVDAGWRNPPIRWLMLAAPINMGVGIYAFYALQPYLLDLYGDPDAFAVAGIAAAIVCRGANRGRVGGPTCQTFVLASHQRIDSRQCRQHRRIAVHRSHVELLGCRCAPRRLGDEHGGEQADASGLCQRADSVRTTGHCSLVRCADGVGRWRCVAGRCSVGLPTSRDTRRRIWWASAIQVVALPFALLARREDAAADHIDVPRKGPSTVR